MMPHRPFEGQKFFTGSASFTESKSPAGPDGSVADGLGQFADVSTIG
jgi:hypothetical protein